MSNGTAPFAKKQVQSAQHSKNPNADWAKEFNMAFSQKNASKTSPGILPTPAPRPTEGISLPVPPTVHNPNFGSKPIFNSAPSSMTYATTTPRTQGSALSTSLSLIAALSSLFAALCLAYSYFTTVP